MLDIDVNYTEKMIVGYRWYDYHNLDPKYPFGHGLSYTNFSFSDMMRIANTVSFNVTNTGSVEGAEVAQVYLAPPADANIFSPGYDYVQKLVGFKKVNLKAGESRMVNIAIPMRAFQYWDVQNRKWQTVEGEWKIKVGSSSRDIRLIK